MTSSNLEVVTWSAPQMGGRTQVQIVADQHRRAAAGVAARRAGQRIGAWAGRLTRFDDRSDLSLLNASAESTEFVRPTLGATLRWAATACERTNGIVDPTLLDARLAAESGSLSTSPSAATGWTVMSAGRATLVGRTSQRGSISTGSPRGGWQIERLISWPIGRPSRSMPTATSVSGSTPAPSG